MNELQTIQSKISDISGEIVMYQPDETIRLEVRLGEDTVWLSQQQMAELFGKDRTVIGRHIRNIYKEELEWDTICAKFAHKTQRGLSRCVLRSTRHPLPNGLWNSLG